MLFIYFQSKIKFSHCIWSIWVFFNIYFDLVPPFYFLKWNCYFSACKNLPNSSCHFWKHKPVFLQISDQSSVPSNMTLHHIFSSKIIYFGQKQPIEVEIFEMFKIRQIAPVNFELTSQFLFKFCIILGCHDILSSYVFYFG